MNLSIERDDKKQESSEGKISHRHGSLKVNSTQLLIISLANEI